MTAKDQYDAILQSLYQTAELARLAGFDSRFVAVAAAEAAVAFTSNLTATTRAEVAGALRESAEEILAVGEQRLHS